MSLSGVESFFPSVAEPKHTHFWTDKINRTDKACHLEELYRNPLFFLLNLFLQLLIWVRVWADQQEQVTHFSIHHNSPATKDWIKMIGRCAFNLSFLPSIKIPVPSCSYNYFMVRFPSYCFLCNNEKGQKKEWICALLLRWSVEDRRGKCLKGLKYQFKTSFSAHHRKRVFRPWRISQGQKRIRATSYWSCLKNAVDKAGVGWYSCFLLKSQRYIAVPW